jgi:hypothetical protein
MSQTLGLWDYRRQVDAIYARVRAGDGERVWNDWRRSRDDLFATHSQTPIDDVSAFSGLDYFPYDPAWRTTGRFVASDETPWGDFVRIGHLEFAVMGREATLPMFWLDTYGGGVFVPFGDLTNGSATYGGGRYLLDSVKGADLGHHGDQVVLDFNYAYHPSCVHSPRWACPLAPADARLGFEVTAGERLIGQDD